MGVGERLDFMSETKIPDDLKFDYDWAVENIDRRKFYGRQIIGLIKRITMLEEVMMKIVASKEAHE